jgi:DNA-binding transcriptional ArsR family regulator
VRPGVGRLSAVGHPDVRLHLPKHHAVASWLTGAGRQSSFIARTRPMALDHERLAAHAAAQRRRGARHRSDLRQPHWDRPPAAQPGGSAPTLVGALQSPSLPPLASPSEAAARLPDTPAPSYRELIELDGTHSARAATRHQPVRELEADPLDLAILASIASLRHLLSSQVHRHHNAGRASSTTQRRLKRLADAGLVERFQFHRRDGGGVPMAYRISEAGLRALAASDTAEGGRRGLPPGRAQPPPRGGDAVLRQARRDIHVAGWVLALLDRIGGASRAIIRGPEEATLHVPHSARAQDRSSLGPAELLLPGGRAAHDFLRTDSTGSLVAVDRFDSLRPDAVVELDRRLTQPGQPIDLLIECDDRLPDRGAVSKLERYDHFLTGWSVHTRRYGERLEAVPLAVFICRDRARARACARSADTILRASRAYAGEYPFDWEYQGRERTLFVAERDIHERLLLAYGIPRLSPEVRVAAAHGDRRAGEALLEQRSLLLPGEEADVEDFAG